MKKPKKHLKTLARLGSYLKKEAAKLEKIIARSGDSEDSSLVEGVVRRLGERRSIALSDLGLIDAADEATRKAVKSARTKKSSSKKPGKASAKKGTKTGAKTGTKTAPKKETKTPAKSSRKSGAKPARKAAAKKTAPARRRAAKAPPAAQM